MKCDVMCMDSGDGVTFSKRQYCCYELPESFVFPSKAEVLGFLAAQFKGMEVLPQVCRLGDGYDVVTFVCASAGEAVARRDEKAEVMVVDGVSKLLYLSAFEREHLEVAQAFIQWCAPGCTRLQPLQVRLDMLRTLPLRQRMPVSSGYPWRRLTLHGLTSEMAGYNPGRQRTLWKEDAFEKLQWGACPWAYRLLAADVALELERPGEVYMIGVAGRPLRVRGRLDARSVGAVGVMLRHVLAAVPMETEGGAA